MHDEERCENCKYYDAENNICTNEEAFRFSDSDEVANLSSVYGHAVQIKADSERVTVPANFGCIHFDFENEDTVVDPEFE